MTSTGMFLVALALFFQPDQYFATTAPMKRSAQSVLTRGNCTAPDSVCKTTVLSPDVGFPFQGNEVVVRGCSSRISCIASDQDELGNLRSVFCCNIDLCNSRGLNATSNGIKAAVETSVAMGVLLLGISVPLIVTLP